MYIRYDAFNRVERPNLILCNPGAAINANEPCPQFLGVLTGCEAIELVYHFNAPTELNFRVNKSYVMADSPVCFESGNTQICTMPGSEVASQVQLYNDIANRRIIYIIGIGHFMITSVTETLGAQKYKDVKAESIEVEVREKNIPFIADGTYRCFYRSNETPPAGTNGLLNMIMDQLHSWRVGHVDDVVRERFRTFNDVDVSLNCLSFLTENFQEAYECIVLFDRQNRSINVYDKEQYAASSDRATSIYLTTSDLIESLEVTQTADSFYSALESIGEDNISIAGVNPLGGNVIYNFSYFYRWFSPALRQAVSSWHSSVLAVQPTYARYCSQRDALVISLSEKTSEVNMYNTIIDVYQTLRNNLQNASVDEVADIVRRINEEIEKNDDGELIDVNEDVVAIIAKVDAIIASYQDLLDAAEEEVADLQDQLDAKNDSISEIINSLAMVNYFTETQYNELLNYIFEGSYKDEYVTITSSMSISDRQDQRQVLYDRARAYLLEHCMPRQEFNLNVGNFTFLGDYEFMTEQLNVGALINVEAPVSLFTSPEDVNAIDDHSEDLTHYEKLFVLSITINYDDCNLSISVGNRFDKSNPKALFDGIFK